MKNLKAPFLAVTLIFLNVSFVSAGPSSPPPPTAKTAGTASALSTDADCDFCEENPTFPINQNLVFLAIGGLALGATAIYKNRIKKASV